MAAPNRAAGSAPKLILNLGSFAPAATSSAAETAAGHGVAAVSSSNPSSAAASPPSPAPQHQQQLLMQMSIKQQQQKFKQQQQQLMAEAGVVESVPPGKQLQQQLLLSIKQQQQNLRAQHKLRAMEQRPEKAKTAPAVSVPLPVVRPALAEPPKPVMPSPFAQFLPEDANMTSSFQALDDDRRKHASVMATTQPKPAVDTRHREAGDRVCKWTNCNRLFHSLEDLVDHIEEEHVPPQSGPQACQWSDCDRRGEKTGRSTLIQHIRKHTHERPFKCSVDWCPQRFSRMDSMHKHLKGHSLAEGGESLTAEPGSYPRPNRKRKAGLQTALRDNEPESAGSSGDEQMESTPVKHTSLLVPPALPPAPTATTHAASYATDPPAASHANGDELSESAQWYRARARALLACFKHELWQNSMLTDELEGLRNSAKRLHVEKEVLLEQLLKTVPI